MLQPGPAVPAASAGGGGDQERAEGAEPAPCAQSSSGAAGTREAWAILRHGERHAAPAALESVTLATGFY